MKTILEYVWLDGYKTQNLRSKIKVVNTADIDFSFSDNMPEISKIPEWNFDGSSTKQAEGDNSECLLKPVRVYRWPYSIKNHFIVLCEVYNANGLPHITNKRHLLEKLHKKYLHDHFWLGFEQEYFITNNRRPLGFPEMGTPRPQGEYYCGVGTNQTVGRKLTLQHMSACIDMGMDITGTNAEVAIGQWEYQIFSKSALKAADDVIISRYVLKLLAEDYGYDINFDPKPVDGDWNGSGMHTNFSNEYMRETGGETYLKDLMSSFKEKHHANIKDYGEGNSMRLTGKHETQHIDVFTYGIADRGASIRVSNDFVRNGYKGYLEDRRPASNANPYVVSVAIIENSCSGTVECSGRNNEK